VHFPYVMLDDFVVMPDHVHGILSIRDCRVGSPPAVARFGYPPPNTLSSIVGAFKAAASKRINADRLTRGAPVWQRNYYERVIRCKAELERVRVYIATNPIRWARTTAKSAR
jgi:putative transposase